MEYDRIRGKDNRIKRGGITGFRPDWLPQEFLTKSRNTWSVQHFRISTSPRATGARLNITVINRLTLITERRGTVLIYSPFGKVGVVLLILEIERIIIMNPKTQLRRWQMDELSCSLCGVEMKDKDSAYGITRGSINELCYGFKIDDDSDWDVYCSACMNEIDKLIGNFKRVR